MIEFAYDSFKELLSKYAIWMYIYYLTTQNIHYQDIIITNSV